MTIILPIQQRQQDTVQLPKVTFDQDTRIKILYYHLHHAIARNAIYVYPAIQALLVVSLGTII